MNIIRVNETTSTNTELSQLLTTEELPEGTVLVAENQTSGRGQSGNSWESEAGKNLLFSIVFYPDFLDLKKRFLLSELTANSMKQVLDKYVQGITVKWPNDIFYQDKKIAGILIENNIQSNIIDQSVIGIGLNVNQEIFSSNTPNAISLKQIIGSEMDLELLIIEIIDCLKSNYEDLKSGKYESIKFFYHDSLYRKSGFHLFSDENGQFRAKIDSVCDTGMLLLETETGEKRECFFKEVSFVF